MGTVLDILKEFAKPILFVLIMGLCAFGGWKLNTYYTGYKASLDQKIEKQVDQALSDIQKNQAQNLVETQELIKKGSAQIVETKVPVIVERKIYQNICLDQDGVKVLEDLKINSIQGRKNIK